MTVVYVHGVPDTASVWDPLRSLLTDRDDVAVQLPGFACEPPPGFTGTRFAYRDWLVEMLEEIGEPVDLVGHDQGSVVSQGVVVARPDLVRSWVLGGGVVAAGIDRRMLDHILSLYRSEPFFGDWAFAAGTDYPPGLVMWGRDDPYQSTSFGQAAAEAAGARYHELDCGHWWQIERPEDVAAALTAHWAGATAAR